MTTCDFFVRAEQACKTRYVTTIMLSLDSFFDTIGYLFDAFVNISPANWKFATVYWESEKNMTNNKSRQVRAGYLKAHTTK